jgi:ABC-type multidrug transport system ATPase subunit
MVKIVLEQVSHKFNAHTIFKNINYTLEQGKSYAITGHNGAGKSTLISIIAGYKTPSKGKVTFYKDNQIIVSESICKEIGIAAPYIDVIEEFTLAELVLFHFKLKKIDIDNVNAFLDFSELAPAKDKLIKNFSSGMKQRLKLALAIFANNSILLLDEPTSNLDKNGLIWYLNKINDVKKGKLIVIASNLEEEFSFVDEVISIKNYQ